jgi:hypothetical protein
MDANRIFLVILWTLFFVAALCVSLELVRRETAPLEGASERLRAPDRRGADGARRPILVTGAFVLGISTLVLEAMAAAS